MRQEVLDLLTSYLAGWKTLQECAEWIAGVDWSQPGMDMESRQMISAVELVVTEVLEGLRPESELYKEASEIVARGGGSMFAQVGDPTPVTIVSSYSGTFLTSPMLVAVPEEPVLSFGSR